MTDLEKIKKDLNLKDDEIDSHETDLYIKHTPERYNKVKSYGVEVFRSNIDGKLWIELPFYLIDDKINRHREIIKNRV